MLSTFSYGYDDLSRMASLTSPMGDETDWTYRPNSWLSSQYDYDGSAASGLLITKNNAMYDARGQLLRLMSVNSSGGTLSQFGSTSGTSAMQYDAAGNRTSMTATLPGYTAYSGTTSYAYDYKDELTGESSTRNSGSVWSYTYDNAGNNDPGHVNADNEFSDSNYAYDGNGNPTTYYNHAATFDPESRTTSFNGNGTGSSGMAAGYGYDGLRAWRTQGGATVYFVYDGITPVVELSSTGAFVALNTFGENGLVSRATGTGTSAKHFYAFDPQGSPAVILSGTGSVVSSLYTNAFGTTTTSNGNFSSDPYAGFGSQWGYYFDWGTGLELLGHRYYDPNARRFINRDPIGYAGGINLYAYVLDSPIRYADPLGFWTFSIGIGVSVVGGGLAGGADINLNFGSGGFGLGGDTWGGFGDGLGVSVGPNIGFSGGSQTPGFSSNPFVTSGIFGELPSGEGLGASLSIDPNACGIGGLSGSGFKDGMLGLRGLGEGDGYYLGGGGTGSFTLPWPKLSDIPITGPVNTNTWPVIQL